MAMNTINPQSTTEFTTIQASIERRIKTSESPHGYVDGQHFYCEPPKDERIVNLKLYNQDFQTLKLYDCTLIQIEDDFIPPSTLYVNIENTNIKMLDLRELK